MPLLIVGGVVILLLILERYAYSRLWNKGLGYNIRFSASEAFEGDTIHMYEELTNNKTLPLPWVYAKMRIPMELSLVDANEQLLTNDDSYGSLYSIMYFSSTRRKTKVVCHKRGVYGIRNTSLSVSNLLHTQKYKEELRMKNELLVFPKILDDYTAISLIYRHMDSVVLTNRIINPDPFEFRGIRDYQFGDPLKAINFRASAISQKLMVNIYTPTCAQRMVLILNLDEYAHRPDYELYEQSIRLCATLAEHYIEKDVSIAFYTNGKNGNNAQSLSLHMGNSSGHLYNLFECLARIALSFKPQPMVEYMNRLADKEQMYVFVSPYHGEDFLEAFEALKERGVASFLVIPTFSNVKVDTSQDIVVWDANQSATIHTELFRTA